MQTVWAPWLFPFMNVYGMLGTVRGGGDIGIRFSIAPKPGDLPSAHWLPNAGIGYRFEFKPRVNVRLDAGFGRRTRGAYFQINEAF
ncbi:hypothetical protein [Cupriavidus sp. H39]|uniref:hypothetical protein n=1 Tax=Cupriavidus sp. H39 TaxID=3401635 RepID=UPI003CFC91B8